MKLRPYQHHAVESIFEAWEKTASTLLVQPTGTGKTVVMAHVVKRSRPRGRAILVAHREELIFQAASKIRSVTGEDAGIEMAEYASENSWFSRPHVVVATVQTLTSSNAKRLSVFNPMEFGTLLVDECFPAGTLVDGKPIESYRAGDFVTAWDQDRQTLVRKRIVRTFQRPAPRRLIRLCCGGHDLVCTENHPVLLTRGWTPAAAIRPGDYAYVLPTVRSTHKAAITSLSSLLSSGDGSAQPGAILATDASAQPDGQSVHPSADGGYVKGEGTSSPDSRGQRPAHALAPATAVRGTGMGDGNGGGCGLGAGQRLSKPLQDRHRSSGDAAGHRSRRQLTHPLCTPGSGSEERGVLTLTRVDCVEVHEPGGDGRPGGLCSDGYVYNLEVEDVHTYFAHGILVHNCHHSTASTYRTVLNHFRQNPSLRVLGVTATPDRADEEALGQIFESVADVYEIVDAIRDGWLVPIEQRSVYVEGLDLSSVRTTYGDLNDSDLAAVMEYEETLQRIVVPSLELAGNRKTLVFAASLAQAERMCEMYNRYRSACARWVSGDTPKPERRNLFRAFAEDRFQFLVNVGVATEGFDEPGIEVIVMARPTKSRPLYAQMVGRATRPLPGLVDPHPSIEQRRNAIATSAKPHCEVIDLVGNSGKHKLVSVADILGGNYPEEVVERAAFKARQASANVDMLECLKASADELYKEMEKRKAREAARRSGLKVKANYTTQQVDPFDVLQIGPWRERAWDKDKQPSEKMVAMLERQGIATQGLSFAQAKQLVVEIASRWGHGECSFKQSQILNRYGLPTKVSREQAKAWIDSIAGNKWRMPEQLRSQTLQAVEVY